MNIRNRMEVEAALRELCFCPELNEIILRSAGRENVPFGGVIEILQSAHLKYRDEHGDSIVPRGQFEANMCQYIEALLGRGEHADTECVEWVDRLYGLSPVDDAPPFGIPPL